MYTIPIATKLEFTDNVASLQLLYSSLEVQMYYWKVICLVFQRAFKYTAWYA